MTRETKIGLLVGLAFLLVVGILLSEHISGAADRPAAPLADAGHGVRTGMGAPGAAAEEPTTPVPTADDLTDKPAPAPAVAPAPAPTPVQVTVVTPGGNAQPGNAVTHVVVQDRPAETQGVQQPATVTSPIALKTQTDPFANDPIAKVASEHGEAVVPVGKHAAATDTVAAANTTSAREVVAAAGDTLSRLAARLPGGNIKANRDAIVQLNPTLQKDPNHVVSGHKYLLPGAAAAAQQATVSKTTVTTTTTVEKTTADKAAASAKPADPAVADAGRVYVVKAGDTLSKIASAELGSKTQVATIKAMNADVLKGGDAIRVDMKLKLPVKAATKQS